MSLLEQMANIFDANGATLVATNTNKQIVYWSRGAERFFGVSRESALGRCCPDIVEGRDVFGNRYCSHACPVSSILDDGEAVAPFAVKLGENRTPMSCTVVSVPDPSETREGQICMFRPVQAAEHTAFPLESATQTSVEATGTGEHGEPAGNGKNPLTPREREILQLIADSVDTLTIARRLSISQTTVRNHVQNIFRKLDVHSKLEAVLFAQRHTLL